VNAMIDKLFLEKMDDLKFYFRVGAAYCITDTKEIRPECEKVFALFGRNEQSIQRRVVLILKLAH
ncbi:MAG: hypothetical protein ABL962_22385, partial [Fimbriimonadaceae bacterium]